MDTKKYEVFEKTVELSSLTKAAEELGLTQSGVSHIIAALEEEFGFPLLTRSRTGVRSAFIFSSFSLICQAKLLNLQSSNFNF